MVARETQATGSSVVGVPGRASGTTSIQPGSPSVCPRFEWRPDDSKATLVRAAGVKYAA
jgi:hypothetical protein